MAGKIISPRTRSAFRVLITESTLRKIRTAFEDEGFSPVPDPSFQDSSERRTTANEYMKSVNWSDHGECRRALRAMETLLIELSPDSRAGEVPPGWGSFKHALNDDGWTISDAGIISSLAGQNELAGLPTDTLRDASAIHEQVDRLRRSMDDPAAVIGSAKELIESTAKVILNELGVPFDPNEKFNALVKQVQTQLGLDPARTQGVDGEQSTKRILGGASNIALGLNELRNAGHGTGHGQATARTGLHPRHAHLAVNAAALWCELVLETFQDPQAPWRTSHTRGQYPV